MSTLFRFWFLLHSLSGREKETKNCHPTPLLLSIVSLTYRKFINREEKIEIKEDFTLWERNDIAEEELIDKMIGGTRRGVEMVESRAMCRGELGDLTKLAPRTPNDLFLSVSHHCTLTPARPHSRIKYSRWTQFACKERSFQGTETAPPTYLPTYRFESDEFPKESSSAKAVFQTVPPFLTGYGQRVLEKFCIRPGIDRPKPPNRSFPRFPNFFK